MTSLICLAMPGYASDIELYKAPQASETTLMFMLDVSGSMNPESNDYRENRLESLKNGMTSLLQGSSSQGISPIPDNLVVGLATFGGSTGRIKVEAKALGTPIPLAGQRQVLEPSQTILRILKNKTITTVTTEIQERTQKIKSKCSLWIIICLSYERDGSNWSPSDVNAGWINRSPSTNTPPSDPEWQDMGAPRPIGNAVAQECMIGIMTIHVKRGWQVRKRQKTLQIIRLIQALIIMFKVLLLRGRTDITYRNWKLDDAYQW